MNAATCTELFIVVWQKEGRPYSLFECLNKVFGVCCTSQAKRVQFRRARSAEIDATDV